MEQFVILLCSPYWNWLHLDCSNCYTGHQEKFQCSVWQLYKWCMKRAFTCFIRSKGPIVFFPCYCVLSFASTFFPQGPIQNHHTFLRICLILCATFFYVQNKNISTNVSFGGSLWIHNKAWRNHLTFDLLLRTPILIFMWINCSFWRLSDAHKRQTNMTYMYITNWYYNYTLPCQFWRIRENVLLKFRKCNLSYFC